MRLRAKSLCWTIVLALLAVAVLPAGADDVPVLYLDVGYGDTVTSLANPTPSPFPPPATPTLSSATSHAPPPPTPTPSPSTLPKTAALECSGGADGASYELVPATTAAHGITFCIGASLQGLSVKFRLPAPFDFVTPAKLDCTRLPLETDLVSVVVRVGGVVPGKAIVFGNARAECGVTAAFLYALAVESQNSVAFAPVKPRAQKAEWSITVPWNVLHLGAGATNLYVTVNEQQFHLPVCVNPIFARSTQGAASTALPLCRSPSHKNIYRSGTLSADFAPLVQLNTPAPTTGAAPPRLHQVEFNGSFDYGTHDTLIASVAQNQSTVAVQRALSQALSLAPVTVPQPSSEVVIGQDLQTQSQKLFAFQTPSVFLDDQALKPYFDVLPFSVTKIGSLASGFAEGYSSELINGGVFYGLQGAHVYSAVGTVTAALATPAPRPTPTPVPTPAPQPTISRTGFTAPQHRPLQPPPPPAPFFESGTQSTRPLEVSYVHGFTLSNGTRDTVDALAFESHLLEIQTPAGTRYHAETFDLFGRLEQDFRSPTLALSPSSTSRFLGEASTFTAATTNRGTSYFQIRESAGMQLDDPYFAPTSGSVTWLSSLNGPFAHVTASLAGGPGARYEALDLFGFRLTNANGDIAAQEGWQLSLPIPHAPAGWIFSGGSETQTVSDRLAAVEQGLVSTYASAVTSVLPTVGTAATIMPSAIRPQRLGNVRFDSPEFGGKSFQVKLTGGYDFGTVSACGAIGTKAPTYQCLTATDNRIVGGAFFSTGKLAFGATDTSVASGTVSAAAAGRNLGATGSLPGSTTAYLTYDLCPGIALAYTNAAFPSGVPLPQQGSTASAELQVPVSFGAQTSDLVVGGFNERDFPNPAFNESGFFVVLRLGTAFSTAPKAACNSHRS